MQWESKLQLQETHGVELGRQDKIGRKHNTMYEIKCIGKRWENRWNTLETFFSSSKDFLIFSETQALCLTTFTFSCWATYHSIGSYCTSWITQFMSPRFWLFSPSTLQVPRLLFQRIGVSLVWQDSGSCTQDKLTPETEWLLTLKVWRRKASTFGRHSALMRCWLSQQNKFPCLGLLNPPLIEYKRLNHRFQDDSSFNCIAI